MIATQPDNDVAQSSAGAWESLGRVRCVFVQEVRRDDEVLAKARVTVASVAGDNMKPVEIPEGLRKKMEAAL